MKRIVVDLSEFQDWKGHLTGVQRVVYGLAEHLYQHHGNVIFCTYDAVSKQLVEDSIENYIEKARDDEPDISTTGRVQRSPQAIARNLYFKVPLGARNKLTAKQKQQLKGIAKRAYHAARRARHVTTRVKQKAAAPLVNKTLVTLTRDDILLIPGRFWDHTEYQNYIYKLKPRIGFKIAVVVYDLIPIYQQHTFGQGLTEPYANYLFNTLTYADYVLPISRSSERDLKRFSTETGFLNFPTSHVIRLGDDIFSGQSKRPEWITDNKPFVLCVGTIEARKNHNLLYMTYKLAAEQGTVMPTLYIIGKPGWLTSDVIYFVQNDIVLSKQISIQSSVTDAELDWLYRNALFSVYPSQYEGWGLPIAESLTYGLPCMASQASSMSEISPNCVDYISPFDTAQALEVMRKLSDRTYNRNRRAKITKEYVPATWDNTAQQIAKLLTEP